VDRTRRHHYTHRRRHRCRFHRRRRGQVRRKWPRSGGVDQGATTPGSMPMRRTMASSVC
jgi:hypothetical protein